MQQSVSYLKKFVIVLNKGIAYAVMSMIQLYRLVLSPYMGGNCRFHPTCSHYAEEAYATLPLLMATKYVSKRLLACRPLSSKEGYDPVPEVTKNV